MWRKTLALMALVITGALFATDGASAQAQIITSDATAQFVPLEAGKFIVIDLPVDAKDVLVGRPDIANVIMQTPRRVSILALSPGQTNIAFYDADSQPIEVLDITVQSYPVPARFSPGPENVVIVFRGPGGPKS